MKLTILALRNIKRNITKYIMYIFSLTFSVFTVYSFLALMQNEYVNMAFTYDDRYRSLLMGFGIIIMVFVLFFLISANNSFIKARKREISTYALFGMTNMKIGKLIFLETIMVGMVTLIIGIGVGIFFSKLMAMFLLEISLANFTGEISFTIDPKSIYLTMGIFVSIFCVLGLSGLRVINKFELVELFKAEKVSEGKSEGSTIILLISLLLIGMGYYLASSNEPYRVVTSSIPVLVLVIIGTYLFFWNGFPKVLSLIKKNKIFYYEGINLISISTFSHKMKSIASVMATIAVLSAVATTAIATGFTLYSNAEKNTYGIIGYDMYFIGGEKEPLNEVHDVLQRNNSQVIDEYTTKLYEAKPKMETLYIGERKFIDLKEDYFRIYPQSTYNKMIAISKGKLETVNIQPGEALYQYPYSTEDIERAMMGQSLYFSDNTIEITSTVRTGILSFGPGHTLILSDKDFNELVQRGDIIASGEIREGYDRVTILNFQGALKSKKINDELLKTLDGNVTSSRTAFNHYNESLESFGLICFIGFFMSVVFILMTASLLYFKQLMAAEEERHQYKMLRKIGMDIQAEKKVVTKRLMPIFFIPLVMGIIHSIFAMKAADTVVFSNVIPVDNSYITVLGFSSAMYGAYIMIYGIFYFITKGQYSRIIN